MAEAVRGGRAAVRAGGVLLVVELGEEVNNIDLTPRTARAPLLCSGRLKP